MNSNDNLELGWCQGYMGIQYHMEDAYKELNKPLDNVSCNPPYAIFSKKYYNDILSIDNTKKYDYCFIGSINSGYNNRLWVIEFVKKYFTEKSIFINTDNDINWVSLGSFDFTNKGLGFNPKIQNDNNSRNVQYRIVNDNLFYFKTMRQSNFVLCPAGDAPWSFRFYEILMCESIPIVLSWHHTYRTKEESTIPFKYYLSNEYHIHFYDEDIIKNNTLLFKQYHLL
jgi:hypothetical protein